MNNSDTSLSPPTAQGHFELWTTSNKKPPHLSGNLFVAAGTVLLTSARQIRDLRAVAGAVADAQLCRPRSYRRGRKRDIDHAFGLGRKTACAGRRGDRIVSGRGQDDIAQTDGLVVGQSKRLGRA